MWYSIRHYVNADEKDFADVVTKILAANLRIYPPTLRFFAPCTFGAIRASDRCVGFTQPSDTRQIFIRSGLRPPELFATIAHEVRHCAQLRTNEWRSRMSRKLLERDARIFAHEMPLVPSNLTFSEAKKWLLRWHVHQSNKKIKQRMGLSETFTSLDIEIR